jgi:ADP-heptose:LPS heptosyltransferase
MRLAVGLASGLGNAVFMLPAIKALKGIGNRIALYVQTDFATESLWKRCIYADEVHCGDDPVGEGKLVCGQWMPTAWRHRHDLRAVPRFQIGVPYSMSEARSNMRLAEYSGFRGEMPDVSGWCRGLDRTPRWDIGIVPGSKTGVWLRKRWPGMPVVADQFVRSGKKVAVFGLEDDGCETIPGERIDTRDISTLPDFLAGCRVIVGTDSGVTHLASSLGIPCVVIFTATSEVKGKPIGPAKLILAGGLDCRPCQSTPVWHRCNDWRCRNINPVSVIAAAEEMLEEKRS